MGLLISVRINSVNFTQLLFGNTYADLASQIKAWLIAVFEQAQAEGTYADVWENVRSEGVIQILIIYYIIYCFLVTAAHWIYGISVLQSQSSIIAHCQYLFHYYYIG